MCTQEQYTYLYAQALLHRLAKEPHGHMMRRLSQELELAVQPQYFFSSFFSIFFFFFSL